MGAKKYKIVKTKPDILNPEITHYHAEVKYWYWPFWIKFTGYYETKEEVKYLINNKDELEKNKKGKAQNGKA